MNSKLNLILFIILGLLLAALIGRNGAVALLAIPFMVYLGMALVDSPGNIQLQASRRLGSFRSKEDAPNRMLITIENPGTPIHRVQLSETTQPKMNLVNGSLEQRFTIHSNEKVELRYTFNAPRGRYQWSRVRLTASDPFGLFEKTHELPAEVHTLVLPEPHKLDRIKFRPRPNIRAAGLNLSRLPGAGIDFWGVREYHPGDSLRAIHWRLAARHPRSFYSKEFEREEMADIGILLDARLAANPYRGADNLFEFSVQASAALAKNFLSSGNRVSMLVLSDRLVRVFPGYGKRQLVRILDQLAGCTLGERVTFETLKYLPVRLFPSHSVIVIISSLLTQDFDTIARLRAEGYQLLLVSPNPVQWAAMDPSPGTSDALAIRAAGLEREVLLRRIRQMGVQVIDWKVDQSLVSTLQSARFVRM